MQGYEDGSFRADNNTTRAEFIVIVNRFIGAEEAQLYFTDVDESNWYYNQLKKAIKAEYIDNAGSFRGDDFITRDETAQIFAKIYKLEGKIIPDTYSDVDKVKNKLAFGELIEKGIIKGYPDGTLRPEANLSRAEMCALFQRCNQTLGRPIVLRTQEKQRQIENNSNSGAVFFSLDVSENNYDYVPNQRPWIPKPWISQSWEPQINIIYKNVGDTGISLEEAKNAITNLPDDAELEIIKQPGLSQAGNDVLIVRVYIPEIADRSVSIPVIIKGEVLTPVTDYKVTFDSNGGSPVAQQQVQEGERAVRPDDPTLKNHTFVEWQLNGIRFDFEMPITDDIILTAKWQLNAVVEDPVVIEDPQGEVTPGYVRLTFTAQAGGDFGSGVTVKKYDVLEGKTWSEAKAGGLYIPTPLAAQGYEFERWSPAIPEDATEVATTEYKAIFVENTITLTYIASAGGSVTPATETVKAITDTIQGSEATADEGYIFVNWTDVEGNEVGNEVKYIPLERKTATYRANFKVKDVVVENPVVIEDPQGEITPGYVRLTFTAQAGGDFGSGVTVKKYDVLEGKT
ncbi:Hypothetical protein ING2D1G_0291 [Peptoniphilus sp. ING2-D1G]|nr:Hypothetical protein ING2D1G_0291 [Peptoniphilus sp. ING2-D1G]